MDFGQSAPAGSPELLKSMQFHHAAQEKQRAGDNQKAVLFYQAAIKTCPMNGAPYAELLKLLITLQEHESALQVVKAVPSGLYEKSEQIRLYHAVALIERGAPEEALAILKALSERTSFSPGLVHNNMGTCYYRLQDFENAIRCYRKAEEAGSIDPVMFANLASAVYKSGEVDKAARIYQRAAKQFPENSDLMYEYALFHLTNGDFSKGFEVYRHRLGAKAFGMARAQLSTLPEWGGEEDIARLLVVLEQGIGDQVVFSALLENIRNRVGQVVVSADERLVPLLQRSYPELEVISHAVQQDSDAVVGCDAYIRSGDLGKYSNGRYGFAEQFLVPEPDRVREFRDRYEALFPGKILIGVAWRSKRELYGEMKTVALEHWRPVLDRENVQFINFQYGDVASELEEFERATGICIYNDTQLDTFNDLEGVAAQSEALDLIITTSNSNAHLAAAVGAKTWLVAPRGSGLLWYWGQDGSQCAWYPSVEVFRPRRVGAWDQVMSVVSSRLDKFASEIQE